VALKSLYKKVDMCYNKIIKIILKYMTKKTQTEAKADVKINIPVKFKIIESKADGEKGIIEAYVSIFDNVDLVGDIIKQGAFAESLAKKLPKGVWAHNWDEPIAKTLEAREDSKGLYIKGQFIEGVQKADEAYKLIKEGVIDEFSIGFRILGYEWSEDDPDVRIITKARLYEWSPVLAGANPDTELISIKDDQPKDEKEKEEKDKEEKETEETEETEEVEEEKNVKKIDFVKVDEKSGTITLFYKDGEEKKSEVLKMSDKFKKYQSELRAHKTKVGTNEGEGNSNPNKILRIRQVAKQNLKASQYLLRITKN